MAAPPRKPPPDNRPGGIIVGQRRAAMPRGRTPPLQAMPAALVAAVLALGGCQGGPTQPPDPWLSPPVEAGAGADGAAAELAAARPLDPTIVRLALEPFQDEAERLLADVPWVQLTADDAARLAGWADAPEPNHLYLLRGLELPAARTGGLRVRQSPAGDLLVTFEGPGRSAGQGPTRRQPVVVMVDRSPRNVYVVTSALE